MSTWRVVRAFVLWGPLPAALALSIATAFGAPDVLVPTLLLTYVAGLVPAVLAGLVFQMLASLADDFAQGSTRSTRGSSLALHGALGAAAGAAAGLLCHVLLDSTRAHPVALGSAVADLSFLVPFVLPGAVGRLVAGARCGWLLAGRATESKA